MPGRADVVQGDFSDDENIPGYKDVGMDAWPEQCAHLLVQKGGLSLGDSSKSEEDQSVKS